MAGRWAFLQSNAIVKLYGMTLSSPFAMVMEYLDLGQLDEYLRHHKNEIKAVDLVEAGTYLASALWHLVCAPSAHDCEPCLSDTLLHYLTDTANVAISNQYLRGSAPN